MMITNGGHDETVSTPRKKHHLMVEIKTKKENIMNIVIFGANGATGKILTKQALDSGHSVTAVTRHPEAFPLRDARLNVMGGDVFDLALVERVVAGQDAVRCHTEFCVMAYYSRTRKLGLDWL